jgi:CHAT domain-containing protein
LSLHNLALLLVDLGRPAEGLPLSLEAVEIVAAVLDATAALQSERQQMAMTNSLRHRSDTFVSLAQHAHADADTVYQQLLAHKGQSLVRERVVRQLREQVARMPESPAAQVFVELADRTRELDRQAKLVPEPMALEAHRQRLEELTQEVERLHESLAVLSAAYQESDQAVALTPADLSVLLQPHTALVDVRAYLQYLPQDDQHAARRWELQYVAFVIRREEPAEIVWLGAGEAIDRAVAEWREHTGREEEGRALRRLVWEPLSPHLEGATTILISPDRALNGIPFGALPGSAPDTYLIEDLTFVTVPAPMLLSEILDRPTDEVTAPSLLTIGDVDYGADPGALQLSGVDHSSTAARGGDGLSSWETLPNFRVEIDEIEDTFRRVYHDAPALSLRHADATEQAFRDQAPLANYLHLSTHGYFAPEELKSVLSASRADEEAISLFSQQDVSGWHPGLLSGIVLAGANRPADPNRDDGVLTALEVAALDLSQVELATLSACETGLGLTAGGEGVLGLQRSFQLAGARTTVTSLWEVPDAATRALMVEFYENLWVKKLPRGEALRQAQLMMLREGVDRGVNRGVNRVGPDEVTGCLPPYYWAAFVLSGDWR